MQPNPKVCMETAGEFHIGGGAMVSLDADEDGGVLWPEQTRPTRPFFDVAPDASGFLPGLVLLQ
jgi:hypothetical protein